MRRSVALVMSSLALLFGRPAQADRELIVPFQEGGHLVFDQLSGTRLGPAGFGYAGPAGVVVRTEKADPAAPGGPTSEAKTTTLWLAPSADLFVADHVSVGALLAFSYTWGTATDPAGQRLARSATSTALLPRAGFYVPVTDRVGVWPRVALGWTKASSAAGTLEALEMDVDVGLVWRMNESIFVKVGPEVGVTLAGSRTPPTGGATEASLLDLAGVVALGVNVEP